VNAFKVTEALTTPIVIVGPGEELRRLLYALEDWREDWRGTEHHAQDCERRLIEAFDAALAATTPTT